MTLLRRETPAFAQQKWPGGTLYHSGQCELAQRQAVLLRKDKSPIRAIKSDRAKVVMTAGCISRIFDIPNYIYNSRERQLDKSEFTAPANALLHILCIAAIWKPTAAPKVSKSAFSFFERAMTAGTIAIFSLVRGISLHCSSLTKIQISQFMPPTPVTDSLGYILSH